MYFPWKYIIMFSKAHYFKKYKHSMDLGWELKPERSQKLVSELIYMRFTSQSASQKPLSIFVQV